MQASMRMLLTGALMAGALTTGVSGHGAEVVLRGGKSGRW